ncbi:MAG: hypothetical protein AMXMBFR58_23720 [Phycisphaerae bacterium]|nr:hypothetical protein [Phycisphaerales bacterium]
MTSATFDPKGFDAEPEVLEPERVSILAILGLVFGLICFIPILPLLGVVFAISGLIAINRSRGRLAGTGMAIAGLILGLLFTALQGAIVLGMAQALSIFSKELVSPAGSIASAIDTADYPAVRQGLVAQTRDLATDEAVNTFKDAYKDELGAFQSVPTGMDLVLAYFELGPQFQAMQGMQGVQGRQDLMPVPAKFEKGMGLFIFTFEPPQHNNGPPTSGQLFKFRNVTLITPGAKVYNLIDPALIPAAPAGILPPPPPPPADQPKAPDAPQDSPPETDQPSKDGGSGSQSGGG